MGETNDDVFLTELRAAVGQRGRQVALAKAVGVAPQTINKWVQGQTRPEPQSWRAIEDCLGWPSGRINDLLGPEPGDLVKRIEHLEAEVLRLTQEARDQAPMSSPVRPARGKRGRP